MFLVNANIVRNFDLGGRRSLQFRMDVQNLFDAVQWGNPNLDPTSTNFGKDHDGDQQHHAVLHVRLEGELLTTKARTTRTSTARDGTSSLAVFF